MVACEVIPTSLIKFVTHKCLLHMSLPQSVQYEVAGKPC